MQPRISMISLGVRDLEVAIGFYEKGLGLPRMKSPPEVAFFTLDGTWLGLYGREALAEDATVSAEGAGFAGVAFLPATAVPAGRTPSGLPVGLQIVGPYLEDRTTLALARVVAEATGGFEPPPRYRERGGSVGGSTG